jgi:signal transduction histidine kinase
MEILHFVIPRKKNRNILSDATKYSPDGRLIGVTRSEDDNWITIAFTDQGKGMTNSQLHDFFHLKDNISDTGDLLKGAGMAMSICSDMIAQMNGRIWAESLVGEGTTFYYTLPKWKSKINVEGY